MGKRIPLRQCLGCRTMKPKNEIIRLAKSPEGEISIDLTGKKPGRGAYVCRKTECIKRIIKSNALARAFKTKIPEDIIGELQIQSENSELINES